MLGRPFISDPARVGRWLAMFAAVAAAVLMIERSLGARAVDFSYILTAGRMWLAGADPYGAGFAAAGGANLPAGPTGFAYPPNWWVIAVALAAIPGGGALLAWKLLNLASAAAAGFLLIRSARRIQPDGPEWLNYAFLACLFSCGAMANALRLGQTSILILLGFALLIEGLTFDRRFRQILGLSLLLLKPQIGLLFLLLAFARKPTRPAAVGACLATVVACLPILFSLDFAGTFASATNFVGNLGSYDKLPWNWPAYMSGLPFIFAEVGLRLSPLIAIAAAWFIAEFSLRPRDASRQVTDFWLISTGALAAMIPLHLYDFILCVPCLLLLPSLRDRVSAGLVVLCVLLVWCANDLARALFLLSGSTDHAYWAATRLEAGLMTLGGVAILAAGLRQRFGAIGVGRLQPFLARKEEASAAAE